MLLRRWALSRRSVDLKVSRFIRCLIHLFCPLHSFFIHISEVLPNSTWTIFIVQFDAVPKKYFTYYIGAWLVSFLAEDPGQNVKKTWLTLLWWCTFKPFQYYYLCTNQVVASNWVSSHLLTDHPTLALMSTTFVEVVLNTVNTSIWPCYKFTIALYNLPYMINVS